jgi:hypothetical protein
VRGSVLIAAASALLLAAACGSDEAASPTERREETGSDLEAVPLQDDEVPEGLGRSEAGTGPVGSLREFVPPRSAFPNRPPLPPVLAAAFRGGYEIVYLRAEGVTEGPASVSSAAIRFSGPEPASTFLDYFREVQVGAGRGPERAEVPVSDLGDEAFGWHLEEPFGESSTVVWRSGDLVLTVSLGGATGTSDPARAAGLAHIVDRRVSSS